MHKCFLRSSLRADNINLLRLSAAPDGNLAAGGPHHNVLPSHNLGFGFAGMSLQRGDFDTLVDRYFREYWTHCPSAGSRAGLYEFDSQLEQPDSNWFDQRGNHIARTLVELGKLPVPPPGTAASLDRKVFESHLMVSNLRLRDMQHWRQDPSAPVTESVDAIFELLMRRDLATDHAADAIVSRLEQIPAYLRAARERLDDPVALWTEIAAQTIHGGIEFIRDAMRELSNRHARLDHRIARAVEDSCGALEDYGRWIAWRREEGLKEDVAVGAPVMEALLSDWHGLECTLEDVDKLGRGLVQFFREELEHCARRIDPQSNWQQILERARTEFVSRRRDMLGEYKRITSELRDRMERDQLLDLPPGETCKVISSPAFLRALLPTAAYTNPGPLDPKQVGVFFVSDPDPRLDRKDYEANVAQHYGIEETCVHEGYPGHHVQLCWANRAGSLVRQMADHIIFMEGWTLYCEQWMIEAEWFDDPALKINYLLGQLWRAYRMIIDVGIHTRRMTVPQAVTLLMEGVGFTRDRAVAELNWYSQSPCVPLSYMMGKRETLELRDAFFKRSKGGLREFHSWLLQFGSIPQRWLWDQLPK